MVRWDAPLFTVPWNEELALVEEIWQAVTTGVLKPPNAGTSSVIVRIAEARLIILTAIQAPRPPSDALQALETTTASIVSEIMSSPQGSGIMSGSTVSINSASVRIMVQMPARTVTLSELQRLKRQFVTMHKKAITLGATESGDVDWSEDGIAAKFGHYLEERLGSD
jgi:protein KTI12